MRAMACWLSIFPGCGVESFEIGAAATSPASRRSSRIASGTTSKSSKQTMHWSAMLMESFAKMCVNKRGGSHEKDLWLWWGFICWRKSVLELVVVLDGTGSFGWKMERSLSLARGRGKGTRDASLRCRRANQGTGSRCNRFLCCPS